MKIRKVNESSVIVQHKEKKKVKAATPNPKGIYLSPFPFQSKYI